MRDACENFASLRDRKQFKDVFQSSGKTPYTAPTEIVGLNSLFGSFRILSFICCGEEGGTQPKYYACVTGRGLDLNTF